MAEHAGRQAAAAGTGTSSTLVAPLASAQITALSGYAVMRLKSWSPEAVNGDKPVVLANRELPSQVGAMLEGETLEGAMRVLCIGPGDWLLISPEQSAESLRARLETDLPTHGLALVDLSDGLDIIEVRGPAARDALSKACGLDLHPRSFPAGQCARTRLAQIPVVIACLDGPPRFELAVARSYGQYLQACLTDAAAEFESATT